MRFPVSVIAWVVAFFVTLFFASIGIFLIAPFSLIVGWKARDAMDFLSRIWGRILLILIPLWDLKIEGRKNINPQKNYVIIANHQSILDILVVVAGLDLHFKFLAKKEVFAIPLMGWYMALAGYIPLIRGNHESAKQAIGYAREHLRRGMSVLFFPEGTRSLDGEIHDFKLGAFRLAQDERVDILPVVIDGTGDVAPKRSWLFKKRAHFCLSIGNPISTHGENVPSFEKISASVREEMKARLAVIRGRTNPGHKA
ncbi:MAG: 1-acyl-sn-glycerol-3-phosphate acyltransferase [Candidatus Omnitrophica bacterium]|nr:1-acyl-sn-glycerol-3-phosphate acyltransferase [Candidatus Omnitrophota bacterium]